MELPQNSGKCRVEIRPSPSLVFVCVTLGHNYHFVCVCSGQVVWNSSCPVPPPQVVCFQQQMGCRWGGCGMRNTSCFLGVHYKEKDDCWCRIIHLAIGEAAFGVNHLLENGQELSLSSPSKASCQLNDVEEEGLLLQLWFSSGAIPSLLAVLSPRQCFTTAWARAVPQLSWQYWVPLEYWCSEETNPPLSGVLVWFTEQLSTCKQEFYRKKPQWKLYSAPSGMNFRSPRNPSLWKQFVLDEVVCVSW